MEPAPSGCAVSLVCLLPDQKVQTPGSSLPQTPDSWFPRGRRGKHGGGGGFHEGAGPGRQRDPRLSAPPPAQASAGLAEPSAELAAGSVLCCTSAALRGQSGCLLLGSGG